MKAILTSIKDRACCAYIALTASFLIVFLFLLCLLVAPFRAAGKVGIEWAESFADTITDNISDWVELVLRVIMSDDFVESKVGMCDSLYDYMVTALVKVFKQ